MHYLKKKWVIALIILIIVILFFQFRSSSEVTPVEEISPVITKVQKSIVVSGVVESTDLADLNFVQSGVIDQVFVKEGEYVSTGDIIASLRRNSLYNDIQAARDARDIKLREKDLFIENHQTDLEGYGGKDEYNIRVRQLDEEISRANAQLFSLQSQAQNYYIYAPFDGTILEVNYVPSQSVLSTNTIATLSTLNEQVFKINLDQEDFGLLSTFEDAQILVTLDSYPNKPIPAQVKSYPLYIDSDTTSDIQLELTIFPQEDQVILLGMEGDAEIIFEETETEVTSLLFDQVFEDELGYYIWISEEGILRKYPVEIGVEGNIYTQILTDLSDVNVVLPIEQDPNEDSKVKIQK